MFSNTQPYFYDFLKIYFRGVWNFLLLIILSDRISQNINKEYNNRDREENGLVCCCSVANISCFCRVYDGQYAYI